MSKLSIDADSFVGSVMDAYPQTIAVFVRRRMHCPGCVMSPFMTVAEAATSYGIESEALLDDLRAAATASAAGGRP